jgi:hypothetical protein
MGNKGEQIGRAWVKQGKPDAFGDRKTYLSMKITVWRDTIKLFAFPEERQKSSNYPDFKIVFYNDALQTWVRVGAIWYKKFKNEVVGGFSHYLSMSFRVNNTEIYATATQNYKKDNNGADYNIYSTIKTRGKIKKSLPKEKWGGSREG